MADQIHLERLYKETLIREKKKLELIKDLEKMPFHLLAFRGINEVFFVYTAAVKNDIQMSKIYLYKIGMTYSFFYEKLNGEVFATLNAFTFPILSDCSSLISRYLDYNRTEYVDAFSTYFGKAIQSVLNNDVSSLQVNIQGLKKWSTKGWAKQYIGVITVFEGFLTNDRATIEKGLQKIVDLHDKQEQPAIVGDYINLEATALAKLAWRKSIEVEVRSDLIPKGMLPVKELPFYEGYDFFKEIDSV